MPSRVADRRFSVGIAASRRAKVGSGSRWTLLALLDCSQGEVQAVSSTPTRERLRRCGHRGLPARGDRGHVVGSGQDHVAEPCWLFINPEGESIHLRQRERYEEIRDDNHHLEFDAQPFLPRRAATPACRAKPESGR
jgi:hypothetical protein